MSVHASRPTLFAALRHARAATGAALLAVGVVSLTGTTACSDAPTPDCFERDSFGRCVIPGPDINLAVTCTNLPDGALRATYSFTPTITGTSNYTVMATGLPAGLTVSAATGEIVGVPEETGTFSNIELTVDSTSTDDSVTVTCEQLVVNDALTFDPAMTEKGCVDVDEDVFSMLSGGTGAPVQCALDPVSSPSPTCPIRDGNGVIPAGLTFDDASCQATGSITEDSLGTWAWIVELDQNGAKLYVPFCATNEPPTYHDVSIDAVGGMDPLLPLSVQYDPAAALDVGGTDPDALPAPIFSVDAGSNCATDGCNNYGYSFAVSCSPFDSPFSAQPSASLDDGAGATIGFTHSLGLSTQGNTVAMQGDAATPNRDFTTRPFVVDFTIDYCTAGDATTCDDDNIAANAQTRFNYAVIAWPQP
jgi:hypothetical protein